MWRLHWQLPANVLAKLYYYLVYSCMTYALLARGILGRTTSAKIDREESMQITHAL